MQLRRFTLVSAALIVLLALFGAIGTASSQTFDAADLGIASFQTTLLGENEVPGPGAPDGVGFATITLVESEGLVCFGLAAFGIEPATAAHIHEGDVDVAGPVVVPLTPPTTGGSGGCVEADPELIGDIIDNPSGYYVNVHNEEYPAGALRGQLG